MNIWEMHRTDCLKLAFKARGDPLAEGSIGLEPFLEALEAHAGEWMPTLVEGERKRKYSRASVLKGLQETRKHSTGPSVWMKRTTPPDLEIEMHVWSHPWPWQFSVNVRIWPLSLVEEPARAVEWSEHLVALARAWGSHYPVTQVLAHGGADAELSLYWEGRPDEGPGEAPREWLKTIFWLNVLGKEWVDGLGRARVLSTPGHLVEELPNGAVLLVTRPTVADWASGEARQAQARALVHLRPELDFQAVLHQLLQRSAALAPVEPRFEADSAPLLQRVADWHSASERPRKIAELNAFRPHEVEEWLPLQAAPASDVGDPEAALAHYRGLAEDLVIILHSEVPSVFEGTPQSLTDIDFQLWREKFPDFYQREKVEQRALPAVGAYLGEVLVHHLGGRWVPRRRLEEAQVIVGDRAWLPFARARRYLQSTQSLLDYSLTKLYRQAERHRSR